VHIFNKKRGPEQRGGNVSQNNTDVHTLRYSDKVGLVFWLGPKHILSFPQVKSSRGEKAVKDALKHAEEQTLYTGYPTLRSYNKAKGFSLTTVNTQPDRSK
jgi:hypothetical protein